MRLVEVLTRIQVSSLTLRATDDRLIVEGDKPLTDPQRQFIKAHKAAILKALEPPLNLPPPLQSRL